ncbi:NUDIX hydrolase [Candidatus Neptunochlamydia vexilliferae]|nr:NUDIX domain-containing protein [Candidatus Neptunochlamydia vexilliferae]
MKPLRILPMTMTDRAESVNGIVFSKDRKEVLLIKRRDVPVWVLPGGGIDPGESPEEAVVREMEEETGCSAKIIRKVAEYTPICRLARFTHFFECKMMGSPKATDETQGAAFFPLDALPEMPPPYAEWIADAAGNSSDMVRKKIKSVTYGNLFKHLIRHPILVFRFLLSRVGLHWNS